MDVCRVKANTDVLTNFEVLDLINSKRASKDTTRVIAAVARSEYKVYFDFNLKMDLMKELKTIFCLQVKCSFRYVII